MYLFVVIDLFSRRVVGWSMGSTITSDLAKTALHGALWRRRPIHRVTVHSDQGSQFSSDAWNRFCRDHNLDRSMSRRGNCYDNAVVESFFSSLKKERVRGRTYLTREEARADIFDYIKVFYNRRRRHSKLGMLSPVEFEEVKSESKCVYEIGGSPICKLVGCSRGTYENWKKQNQIIQKY